MIDVKDDRGFLLYRSNVALAQAIGADTNRPMSAKRVRAVLDTMRAHGIFPIARIVVAKDPLLANAHREWAVKRKSDGTPWLDKNGRPWLDPHHRDIWAYAGDLGEEAIALGFGEVQFDYVRFPDEPRLIREASFPLAKGRVRAHVIRDQLGYLHGRFASRKVPMAIDVFGLTATDSTDMGIGQRWEQFVDQADVVLPMTYPSHYAPRHVRARESERPSVRGARPLAARREAAQRGDRRRGQARAVVPGLHARSATLRRDARARADAGRLRQRHPELDAVEPWKPLHRGRATFGDRRRSTNDGKRDRTTSASARQQCGDRVGERPRRVLGQEVARVADDGERGARNGRGETPTELHGEKGVVRSPDHGGRDGDLAEPLARGRASLPHRARADAA